LATERPVVSGLGGDGEDNYGDGLTMAAKMVMERLFVKKGKQVDRRNGNQSQFPELFFPLLKGRARHAQMPLQGKVTGSISSPYLEIHIYEGTCISWQQRS
jgi:hypothetical protein